MKRSNMEETDDKEETKYRIRGWRKRRKYGGKGKVKEDILEYV